MEKKKKILIVSRSFYPDISPRSHRATELAKEFARQGHVVTVLTPKKAEHINIVKTHRLTFKDLGKPLFSDININRKNKFASLFFRALRRGLNFLFDYPNIGLMFQVADNLKKETGYDLLISIAAPHPVHWGVAKVWNKKDKIAKIWVADCGDPYMGASLDTFKKLFYFKYLEKSFCKKTDFITIPFESAKKGYYTEFQYKIKVIPQGFDFNEINVKNVYQPNEIPTFVYAGSIIPNRMDTRPFIDFLLETGKDFKFIIYTKNLNLIEPYLKRAIGKIELHSYIPRNQLLPELAKADFLLYINVKTAVHLPSKIIDYYLAGRPILSINSFDFDKQIVLSFIAGDYTYKLEFSNMDKYRIEKVTQKFLDLAEEKTEK